MDLFKRNDVFVVKEVKEGQICMSENVFKDIAVQCYIEEIGLEEEETKNTTFLDKIMSTVQSNCKVKVRKEEAFIVDLHIKVFYGMNIPTIAQKVRSRIMRDFDAMLGVSNVIVDIHIEGFLDMDRIRKDLS